MAVPGQSAYNSAKFAVRGFTEALRQEMLVERAPVKVTCVHPGAIKKRVLRDTFPENYDRHGNGVAGVDADEGAITSEMGIQFGAARVMGIMRNIQTAVATT